MKKEADLSEKIEIKFKGNYDALINDRREMASLERAVKKSYNTMNAPNPSTCDLLFRKFKEAYGASDDLTIQDVQIDDSTASRRRLLLNNERRLDDAPLQFDFTFFFLINFQCNGCISGGLFGNDGSRRHLLEDKRPQRSTFTKRFNNVLRGHGLPDIGINSLKSVSELETEQCAEEELGKREELTIKFQGSYDALIIDKKKIASLERAVKKSYNTMNAPNPSTCDLLFRKEKIASLERAVKKSYNTMNAPNPSTCDLLFRKVTNVEYLSSTLDSSSSSEDTFSMFFAIEYKCRGCEGDKKWQRRGLFDPAMDEFDAGREDLEVDLREVDLREQRCTCGREADLYRGTTRTEYIRALRKILDVRSDQGKNSYITGVSRTFSSSMASS
eukprot:CAMPEP_0194226952 /NCGR_PEP_ID=MMETSP0156-20130528/42604_1 /TAXON_ID=33649 /ORGANISM="Thalassionema nitzschioides, Strain L26-B" /LENGTH=386 /DNA_ID=CAMNT_0038959419 /DNA_START=616 /DNA_END=1778 /DNA_ORIENTATION=-